MNGEAIEIAKRIKNSSTWDMKDCRTLCSIAGLSEEWGNADGETFEEFVFRAADILGVDIM